MIHANFPPIQIFFPAILNVLAKFPGSQCWISFQCRDAGHTAKGEPFAEVVKTILEHEASEARLLAIGVNCTDPRHVSGLLGLANGVNRREAFPWKMEYVKLPYVVYPNHGDVWDADNNCWLGGGQAVSDSLH